MHIIMPAAGQDAAEDDVIRHLQHKPQQRGECEQIDEDVCAEAEKGVPVSRHPDFRFCDGGHCFWFLGCCCDYAVCV